MLSATHAVADALLRWRAVLWLLPLPLMFFGAPGCSRNDAASEGELPHQQNIRVADWSIDTSKVAPWRTASDQGWVIGNDGSAADYLYRVRGALLISEDAVVVANGGDNTLRLYTRDGTMRSSAGGTGRGPGEFEMLWSLYPYRHDSLAAFDLSLRRVSVYDNQLTFARSYQLPDIGLNGAVYLVGSDDSGTMYFFEDMTDLELGDADGGDGALHHTDGTLWALSDGSEGDPMAIGEFTGTQVWVSSRGTGVGVEVPIFGLVAVIGVTSDFIIGIDSAGQTLEVRNLQGTLTATVQSLHGGRSVTRREREWFIDQQLALVGSEQRRRVLEDTYLTMPDPRVQPAFGRAVRRQSIPSVVPGDERLFVRAYDRAGADQVLWYGVDETGEVWRVMSLPVNFDLLSVRGRQVAGVHRDSDGTETLLVSYVAPS